MKEDFLKAQEARNTNLILTELSSLPDGFIYGGTLNVTDTDVTVNPLIANISGKRVAKPLITNIRDMEWNTLKKSDKRYHIYLDKGGVWYVDSITPVIVEGKYGTYDPRNSRRHVGSIYIKADGTYEDITSGVLGPGSAVNDNVATFNGTTGIIIKDSGIASANINSNTTHRGSNGNEHSNVVTNNAKVTNANHTGDVTGSAGLAIGLLKVATGMIKNDAVTYAKMQNVVNDERILGRISGANGVVEELTAAQSKTMLALNNVPNTNFTTPVADNTTHRGLVTGNPHAVTAGQAGALGISAKAADSSKLNGAVESVSAGNNTIVKRHSSGYIFANYFNTTPNDVSSGVTKVCIETGNDGYIRHGDQAAIRIFIGAGSGNGLDADKVDNLHASSFLRSNANDSASGIITLADLIVTNSADFTAIDGAYSTGWINRSNWSNVHMGSNTGLNVNSNVNHGLGLPLKYLRVKILVSINGTDANSFVVQGYETAVATPGTGTLYYGILINAVDDDNIIIQTGSHGISTIDASGLGRIIDSENWYYNISVFPEMYRPT